MARRKLRSVPDLPTTPREPKPPDRDRFISAGSLSIFKPGAGDGDRKQWLTISQLSRAFLSGRRVRLLGLPVTDTDLFVLQFVYTCGAPEGGRHRWRVYGTPMTLVQSLSLRMILDPANLRKSLRRLQELELLDVHGQEVWTTHQLHRIGAELLWCDQLRSAYPTDTVLDWYTVTKDVDRLFKGMKLDPTKLGDRREVMRRVVEEVQRRCVES
jgi:hypothetical protein